MDFDNIKNQVSNLSLYDLKAGFRKAQNAVMNYTEMEAKVREATNNEPWGASTSSMQEIANGTFNYATLNEIMPMIYKRFTEKSAEEWRQIYKSLQLLEFLIKNGSERVVDDARGHVSLLKMLRQFHFIDQNGKDQGLNVRNRAKELAELLGDVERIRNERKKARSTRNKYGGVEGGAGLGGSGSSRYGGFGSETSSYGGYSGGVYGDGGGFGGSANDYGDSETRRDRFEEYNEYDEGGAPTTSRRKGGSSSAKRSERQKPKEPEVDLFDFGAEDYSAPVAAPVSNGKASMPSDDFGTLQSPGAPDDDFDDFQSASTATNASTIPPPMSSASTTAATQFAAPKPMTAQASNMNNIFNTVSPPPPSSAGTPGANYAAFSVPPPQPTMPTQQAPLMSPQQPTSHTSGYQQAAPNYFGSIQSTANQPQHSSSTGAAAMKSPSTGAPAFKPASSAKPASGADPFASLNIGGATKKPAQSGKGPSLADMAKQKSSAGIWGSPAPQSGQGGAGDLI